MRAGEGIGEAENKREQGKETAHQTDSCWKQLGTPLTANYKLTHEGREARVAEEWRQGNGERHRRQSEEGEEEEHEREIRVDEAREPQLKRRDDGAR